jgi:branched-chain amino acid aminotransferase
MTTAASLAAGDSHMAYLWLDKEIVPWESAVVHVSAVGHASVSSVFEGIKAYWNDEQQQLYIFRLDDHLKRLYDSLRVAELSSPYSRSDLTAAVIGLLVANEARADTYVRPWMYASGIIREHLVPSGAPTTCVIDTWPFTTGLGTRRTCRACVSSWVRIADNVMPPRLKTFSNYHNGRLGMLEAHRHGYDWPIFLNERGRVTEGPGACVFLCKDGRLVTPSLASNILDSITRRTILRLGVEQGIDVEEREVDRTELYTADELFFVGTGWEILPIGDIDGFALGDGEPGPITLLLDREYHRAVRGETDAHPEWLTPVWTDRQGAADQRAD